MAYEHIYIKQYGLQRSGTNFIKMLVEENFSDVKVLNYILGSKHDLYRPEQLLAWKNDLDYLPYLDEEVEHIKQLYLENRLYFIISLKSPFAWLVSFFNIRNRFSKFKFDIELQFDDEFITKGIQQWLRCNRNWISNLKRKFPENVIIVDYNDLILNPVQILTTIKTKFSLVQKSSELLATSLKQMRTGTDLLYGKELESNMHFDVNTYLNKEYLKQFTSQQIQLVNELLEKTTLSTELKHSIHEFATSEI